MSKNLRRCLVLSRPPAFTVPFLLLLCTFFTGSYAQTPTISFHQGVQQYELNAADRVAYGNGLYLTCGGAPFNFYTSSDAVDWQRIPRLPDTLVQMPVFAFGNGRWIVAADSGKIYSSTDLVSWTKSVTNTYANFHDILYQDSTFYVVGDSAMLYTSSDGQNWTRDTPAGVDISTSFTRVVYGNGYLALGAFASDGEEVLARSANGPAGPWSVDTIGQASNIRYAKGHFYLAGNRQVSTDAHTWSTLPNVQNLSAAVYDVFADSSRVYLIGEYWNYPTYYDVLYSSADGVNFGSATPINSFGYSAAYVHQRYFVFKSQLNLVVASDTGNFNYVGADQVTIASNGSNIVKVAPNDRNAFVYSSTDFHHWTLVDTIPPVSPVQGGSVISKVVYDSTKYTITSANTYNSTDGVHWTNAGQSNIPPNPYLDTYHYFRYGSGNYLMWYADGWPQNNLVWHSHDAVTWSGSVVPQDPNNPWEPYPIYFIQNIRYTNGKFFLMESDEGTEIQGTADIYGSADGSDFSTIAMVNRLPANFHVEGYDDILYVPDSAKYYIFGTGYMPGDKPSFFCFSTPDPSDTSITVSNMTTVSGLLPSDQVWDGGYTGMGLHFTYSKGHFISTVFGYYSGRCYLIWSSDGMHWDTRPLDIYTHISSSVVSGDTIRMAGTANAEIEAIFHDSTTTAPDSILNFNAVAYGDSSVLLTWQTSTEHDTRAFIIQRKTKDSDGWERTGRVKAAGNSNTSLSYSFSDLSPVIGANHYRLRLTHTDSIVQVSEIRTVRIRRRPQFNVFPNPAGDQVNISGTETIPGVITLYDASGRVRIQQNYNGGSITLPTGNLRTGAYRLVIRLRDDSQYEQQILHVK